MWNSHRTEDVEFRIHPGQGMWNSFSTGDVELSQHRDSPRGCGILPAQGFTTPVQMWMLRKDPCSSPGSESSHRSFYFYSVFTEPGKQGKVILQHSTESTPIWENISHLLRSRAGQGGSAGVLSAWLCPPWLSSQRHCPCPGRGWGSAGQGSCKERAQQ